MIFFTGILSWTSHYKIRGEAHRPLPTRHPLRRPAAILPEVCIETRGLVKGLRPKQVPLTIKAIKHFVDVRVTDRTIFRVRQEILLAHIGGVIAV